MDTLMKTEQLLIEFDWLEREFGSDVDRGFFANIGLAVGDQFLTRIDDLGAKTVRNHMRGSAFHLATWIAANWWRLRWEPEPTFWQKDTDWRMAHSISAAGNGYVWPNAKFASDGDCIEITTLPETVHARFEPIRYISRVNARISAAEFEQKIDDFMGNIVSRLLSLGIKDNPLSSLWTEILEERRDPDVYRRRKLEAMAGFDPDGAPDELLAELITNESLVGKGALEELAAASRHAVGETLKDILGIVPFQGDPSHGGLRISVPELDSDQAAKDDTGLPWQRASKLARYAREHWGLSNLPIGSKELGDLLKVNADVLTAEIPVLTRMPFALQGGVPGKVDIYVNSARSTTCRFAISRVIGDYLNSKTEERLIPATTAKTARQKFQRAFAQEFLCPFDSLMEKIQTSRPEDDDIAEAAKYFDVSPMMVTTTLVNHGVLEREVLESAA